MYYTFCPISEISEKDIKRVQTELSASQREYISKISEKKRSQSLAARVLLMLMLEKHFPNISVSALCIEENGKPYLNNSEVFVSLTHSGDMVGCVLSSRPVGIDIERIRTPHQKLIARVCIDEEQEYVTQNGEEGFFTLWTLKECYIKAKDCGFSQITKLSFVKDGRIINDDEKIKTGKTGEYIWSVMEI